MYIANNVGVIEFDGSEWRHISANGALVRCLDVDEQGRVWVGGQDELGYLAADSTDNLKYFSLTGLLPDFINQSAWFVRFTQRPGAFTSARTI
jgi:hypothetical protein